MDKKYITVFSQIPPEFSLGTLTEQQKELTEIRYFIVNEIDKRVQNGENKFDLYYELGETLGYSAANVRANYENTKKRLKG
jgi:hypothetical protein